MPPKIRTVTTASGATAVQVVWGYKDRRPVLDHIGSGHTDQDVALLKAQAQRLIDGQQTRLAVDFGGVDGAGSGSLHNPVPITSERAGLLLDG